MKKGKELIGPTESLKQFKNQAKKMINEQGYQCDLSSVSKLMNDNDIPRDLKFAAQIYFRANSLLSSIEKSSQVRDAVLNSMMMMMSSDESANFLPIKELLPFMESASKQKNAFVEYNIEEHGTEEEKSAQKVAYQKAVDEMYQNNPNLSHWGICNKIESNFKRSAKTIYRHTKNPKNK